MREILFRGKPVERFITQMRITNQWDENGFVYGSLIVSEDRCYICTYAECTMNTIIGNGHATMVEVIPETVGQFTGMTNKNGVKIFEGDIVEIGGQRPYVVEFINGGFEPFVIKGWECEREADEYEVIGNIWDNPELLKGEE